MVLASSAPRTHRAWPLATVPQATPGAFSFYPLWPGSVAVNILVSFHEIKHDGFRILARRDSAGVRLITRKGNDFSSRFPFIAMAVSKLPVRSCLIDGEAIVCDDNGLAVFELIRRHRAGEHAVLSAFDLLELDGRDLRREPIERRKTLLAKLLKGSHSSIVSMSITRRTARSYSTRLVGSAVKVLSPRSSARFTVGAARLFG
jgi:ATP-dependent DNA ligase